LQEITILDLVFSAWATNLANLMTNGY